MIDGQLAAVRLMQHSTHCTVESCGKTLVGLVENLPEIPGSAKISASMTSRTRSCETASEFDPQNWWAKWGAILGVARSPKIQSIKGDKRNGHVAFGTFVG